MSKKNRNKFPARQKPAAGPAAAAYEEEPLGKKGRGLLILAAALIVAGYFFLKKADPAGTNVYAKLSPLFLLAGYLLAPAALFARSGRAAHEDK